MGKKQARLKYRSSIPKEAREQILERHFGGEKKSAVYLMRGRVVGLRRFTSDGVLVSERPLNDGFHHGAVFRWSLSGMLTLSRPYLGGKEHGKVWQWSEGGKLLGTYTMRRGTGIELLWAEGKDSKIFLLGVCPKKDGKSHGYQWFINEDGTLSDEFHWVDGPQHGIDRCWSVKGRLKRGYPKYYIHGQQVKGSQYIKACASDPTLPKFDPANNSPKRKFPAEVREAIRRGRGR